MIEYLM